MLMREVNQILLKNILPIGLAQKFLTNPDQSTELYYESYSSCAVMFAAIPNFFKFCNDGNEIRRNSTNGRQGTLKNDDGCLQFILMLNDIICEFDKVSLS